jgi:hypothetical protein
MTLVAAYKINDIPVLIGDMALTKGEMRSLRRKAYIIAPNLAVAWAGHAIVANRVISELRQAFSNTKPIKASKNSLLLIVLRILGLYIPILSAGLSMKRTLASVGIASTQKNCSMRKLY